MARTQTLVQLSDEIVARLDERAAREGRSRSDLIRTAVKTFLEAGRDGEIDRAIVAGYRRVPPVEDPWVSDIAVRSIDAEPW